MYMINIIEGDIEMKKNDIKKYVFFGLEVFEDFDFFLFFNNI